jgi:hypothetical protein
MEPVGKERHIVNVEFTMDGQNTLVAALWSHGKGHQRSLGNVVRAWERIRQCQKKTGILRKDSQLDIVREVTLILHGVIALLVREGSIGTVRVRTEKDLEVVDGLHVRGADMVGATPGSDDQCDFTVSGRAAGDEMHGRVEVGHLLFMRSRLFNFMGSQYPYFSPMERKQSLYKKKEVAPFFILIVMECVNGKSLLLMASDREVFHSE